MRTELHVLNKLHETWNCVRAGYTFEIKVVDVRSLVCSSKGTRDDAVICGSGSSAALRFSAALTLPRQRIWLVVLKHIADILMTVC